MKRFYLLLALSALFLCSCNEKIDLKLLTEKLRNFAPYSVGDIMTFVTDGNDTVRYVVNEWAIDEPECYRSCEKCIPNYSWVGISFNPVDDETKKHGFSVKVSYNDIKFRVIFDKEIYPAHIEYGSEFNDVLPGILTVSNDEYILPRSVKSDTTSTDYLKLVHGRGIVEYTIDGVLWKAVTR